MNLDAKRPLQITLSIRHNSKLAQLLSHLRPLVLLSMARVGICVSRFLKKNLYSPFFELFQRLIFRELELVKSLNYEPVYNAWDGTPVKTGRKRMYQPARSSPIAGFSDTPSRLPPPKPSRMICREPARNFNARLEAAVEKQADLSPEKPANKSAQKPDDLSAEKQADQSAEKPTNQSAVQPADQSAEKPAIISVDQTADTPTGTIARRAPKLNIQSDSCSNLLQEYFFLLQLTFEWLTNMLTVDCM